MADGKTPNNATAQGNDLVDAAGTLGMSLARMGALMASLPFYVLPAKEREDAVAATTRLFIAVGELHLSFMRAAARGLSNAARELAGPAVAETPGTPGAPTRITLETAPPVTR